MIELTLTRPKSTIERDGIAGSNTWIEGKGGIHVCINHDDDDLDLRPTLTFSSRQRKTSSCNLATCLMLLLSSPPPPRPCGLVVVVVVDNRRL